MFILFIYLFLFYFIYVFLCIFLINYLLFNNMKIQFIYRFYTLKWLKIIVIKINKYKFLIVN